MKLVTAIIIALIFGAFFGFYLPDLIDENEQASSVSTSTNIIPIRSDIQGNASVTDGDTIKIDGVRIRFHGIDAPEMDQPCWKDGNQYQCGEASKDYLSRLIGNQPVVCQYLSEDQYGRKVSKCYNHLRQDIEAEMVSSGHATAYLYYSKDYEAEQNQARNAKVGIWAGKFEEPYEFRKRK